MVTIEFPVTSSIPVLNGSILVSNDIRVKARQDRIGESKGRLIDGLLGIGARFARHCFFIDYKIKHEKHLCKPVRQ